MLKTLEREPAFQPPALVAPELKTVETDYDHFKARRARLTDALKGAGARQITGNLRGDGGTVCFVGLADELLGDG